MSLRHTARSRRAVSTLVSVLGLLAVLTVAGLLQYTLSRRAASEVHRIQLSALARLQARSALQELLAQVGKQANEPGTPLFEILRKTMDETWQEQDVTAHLRPPAISLKPGWGRRDAAGAQGRARSEILEYQALLRGTRSSRDIQGSEEWVGVLTLNAVAEVKDSIGSCRRLVEESYEIRTLLIAPPRPFDQVGLFLGRHDAAVDPHKINALRAQLLQEQEAVFREVQEAKPVNLSAEQAARLAQIAKGMLPPEEVARRTPALPDEESAMWGFYHTGRYYLEGLDLVQDLAKIRTEIDRYEAEARAAAQDGERLVEALYHLVDEHSDAVNLIWDYQRVMTIAPKKGERFTSGIAPYLERLTPEYFLDRAHLRIHPDDPVFRRWLDGRSRLEGVLDLRGLGAPLQLKGDLDGRVILIVGEQGASLEDLNQESNLTGSRVVLVSLGGDVEVRGKSHASVIMLGPEGSKDATPGRIRIPYSAYLTGSLIVPNPSPSTLALEGSLHYDGRLMAAYPPAKTLLKAGRGEYLVAVGATPLFAQGRAR